MLLQGWSRLALKRAQAIRARSVCQNAACTRKAWHVLHFSMLTPMVIADRPGIVASHPSATRRPSVSAFWTDVSRFPASNSCWNGALFTSYGLMCSTVRAMVSVPEQGDHNRGRDPGSTWVGGAGSCVCGGSYLRLAASSDGRQGLPSSPSRQLAVAMLSTYGGRPASVQ